MKDTENNNEDVEARLKALAEASGFHTNVPIFEDSYSTLVAHQLANSSIEQTKEKKGRKISDDDQRAIFRFLGYSSKDKPPIS
jgi:predicted DsbA family dithiol-disulfide isomerase